MFESNLMGNIIIVALLNLILPILISFIITVVLYRYIKQYEKKISFIIKPYYSGFIWLGLVTIVCMIKGISIENMNNMLNHEAREFTSSVMDIIKYILNFEPVLWMVGSSMIPVTLLYIDSVRPNHNSEIIKLQENKMKTQDPKLVPYDYEKNIFMTGKNGAGKTVAILNFIQEHIKNKEFCLIMDGKGDLGQYGLYDVCTKLAKKYNRPLYIINQTNPNETHAYNPFAGCNATQIKDMLINMSEWSEEYYKSLASEYWQAMCQFMIDCNIKINFDTLIALSNPAVFLKALNDNEDDISVKDINYYKQVITDSCETIDTARARFSTIARGIGKNLFSPTNTFNLRKAYDENAVVLVILNNLEYTDFARSVGRLVLDDVKNLIGGIARNKEEHKKFLCVYDELSVYFDPMLVDIVNKSRSLGGCNILSTQTIADMDIISSDARRQIIGNMHGFYLLKQADDESAETLARTIGTKKGTEITAKLDSFGKTGDGTSKIVDEFKIHPNMLKELPLEVGYWIDTMVDKSEPIRTKMNYVDVSDIEPYVFKKIGE